MAWSPAAVVCKGELVVASDWLSSVIIAFLYSSWAVGDWGGVKFVAFAAHGWHPTTLLLEGLFKAKVSLRCWLVQPCLLGWPSWRRASANNREGAISTQVWDVVVRDVAVRDVLSAGLGLLANVWWLIAWWLIVDSVEMHWTRLRSQIPIVNQIFIISVLHFSLELFVEPRIRKNSSARWRRQISVHSCRSGLWIYLLLPSAVIFGENCAWSESISPLSRCIVILFLRRRLRLWASTWDEHCVYPWFVLLLNVFF